MQDYSYFPVLDWRSYAIHCTLLRQKYFCQMPEAILYNSLKFCECLNVSCSREGQHEELFSNYWVYSERKWTKCRVVFQLSWGCLITHFSVNLSLQCTLYCRQWGKLIFLNLLLSQLVIFCCKKILILGIFFICFVIFLSCFSVLPIHSSSPDLFISIWNSFQIFVNPFCSSK